MAAKNINNLFDTPSYAEWVELAEGTLKGGSVDDLSRKNEDDIIIKALYASDDQSAVMSDALSSKAARRWVIAQYLEPNNSYDALNAMILDELRGGVEQLIFSSSQKPDVVSKAMKGVMADAIVISFEYPANEAEVLDQILQIWKDQETDPERSRGSVGALVAPETSERLCKFTADQKDILERYPHLRLMKISGANAHREGATAAQEIAVILATFTMLLRDAEQLGLPIAEVIRRLEFDLAIEADLYAGIAKARALRSLLDRMINALGCPCDDLASRLHGITSDRMLSVLDAETNMLRAGTAMLSMALSGLGIITNRPHDWLSGSSSLSRRIARNAHHLLADEAQLAHVADPAQGSYFIDNLTKEVADKAWQLFQEIERAGGLKSASGVIKSWFDIARAERVEQIEGGSEALLGVSIHPASLSGELPEIVEDKLADMTIIRGGNNRPAASWENLVRELKAKKVKCLLLDLGTSQTARAVKRWADIFGFETVAMSVDDRDAGIELIHTANPDLIVFGEGVMISEEDIAGRNNAAILKRCEDFNGNIISEMRSILGALNEKSLS